MCPAVPTMMDFIGFPVYSRKPRFAAETPRPPRNSLRDFLCVLCALGGEMLLTFHLPISTQKCDNRISLHDHVGDPGYNSRNPAQPWADGGRIRANQVAARGTRALHHRAGNFQRDVERALLVQIIARPSEAT